MKTKLFQRAILLASGICAVLVILISQSFYQPSELTLKKNADKSKDQKEVAIHAPSDVAAQGQSVELNTLQPALQEELVLSDKKNDVLVFVRKTTIDFFNTLFRVFISPNAP